MQLTEHFALAELTASSTALRRGIDNTPDAPTIANLSRITAPGMEAVRALLGCPITVLSGYRSPVLNEAVGGSKTSAHVRGYAVDFICPEYGNPREIVTCIEQSNIRFDQIIFEGTWVHISFDPIQRGQILTAHFSAGKATYTQGVA